MRRIIFTLLISVLLLSACTQTEIKNSPAGSVTVKTAPASVYIPSSMPPTSPAAATFTPTAPAQSFAARLKASSQTDCIIAVAADGDRAQVTMHKKIDGLWREILSAKGYVGREGVGQAKEGSPITPEGAYTLGIAFGAENNPGTELAYLKVNGDYYWVDDPASVYYNRLVNIKEVTPDWTSAEHLSEYPAAYAYAVAINYNTSQVPGAGSAMFLHCSIGKATSGCISIPSADMVYVLQNVTSSALIIIAHEKDIFSY